MERFIPRALRELRELLLTFALGPSPCCPASPSHGLSLISHELLLAFPRRLSLHLSDGRFGVALGEGGSIGPGMLHWLGDSSSFVRC